MGMQVGGKGGVKTDINVTPLIDVVLVLLIIFLVTMPIMMRTITLEVPRKIEDFEDPMAASKQISVVMRADLSIVINDGSKDTEIPGTDLAKTLRPMLEQKKTDKIVFVDFEDPVPWREVVVVMDTIRSLAGEAAKQQDPNSSSDPNPIKVALKMKEDKPPPQ
ncbi:MAG: biopolymer transporter ExbD [Kofleriaceae bacterium]|nr:MAG: biopolymer transporter ExbD [Kofleriaceae bacterium]MBZ0235183.1 biopolymer transporter ExbD [Kofleriaceae bacterium]